jgi:ribosomal-protein-alanine N-acetyltransferase
MPNPMFSPPPNAPLPAPPMFDAYQPTLDTERLVLRPFTAADAPAVHGIVSDREIAATTLSIPHPYPPELAAEWVASHPRRWAEGAVAVFAATLREGGELVAAVGLHLDEPHRRGELGYWVARPHWGRGYATEASRALMAFGFGRLELHRVVAQHFSHNPPSGAVMRKLGMRHEGCLRHHIRKWGEFVDVEFYGILADEFAG